MKRGVGRRAGYDFIEEWAFQLILEFDYEFLRLRW